MVLKKEDKEWFASTYQTSLQNVQALLENLLSTITNMGKRVVQVEQAFGELTNVARTRVVDAARKNHTRLVQEMFDGLDILVVPTLVDGPDGKRTRGSITCDQDAVVKFFSDYDGGFEVEFAKKLGFWLVHPSRSAQKRRKDAAAIIKHAKEEAKEKLGLHLQYDKPFELREIQACSQKFLAAVKREGKGLVLAMQVRGGYILVKDVRLAPEYLVPAMHRWSGLVDIVLGKLRQWGSRPPVGPENGVLFDVFGAEYAADQGIFSLSDIGADEMMDAH